PANWGGNRTIPLAGRTYHHADAPSTMRNAALRGGVESAFVDGADPVRVGVVGCGMVAQAEHLQNLLQLFDRFRIAALADPSRTVREAMAARYGVRSVHADHRSLLDAGGIGAVLVSAPAAAHAEIALASPDAGVHVFAEHPLCIRLAAAHPIVR